MIVLCFAAGKKLATFNNVPTSQDQFTKNRLLTIGRNLTNLINTNTLLKHFLASNATRIIDLNNYNSYHILCTSTSIFNIVWFYVFLVFI